MERTCRRSQKSLRCQWLLHRHMSMPAFSLLKNACCSQLIKTMLREVLKVCSSPLYQGSCWNPNNQYLPPNLTSTQTWKRKSSVCFLARKPHKQAWDGPEWPKVKDTFHNSLSHWPQMEFWLSSLIPYLQVALWEYCRVTCSQLRYSNRFLGTPLELLCLDQRWIPDAVLTMSALYLVRYMWNMPKWHDTYESMLQKARCGCIWILMTKKRCRAFWKIPFHVF